MFTVLLLGHNLGFKPPNLSIAAVYFGVVEKFLISIKDTKAEKRPFTLFAILTYSRNYGTWSLLLWRTHTAIVFGIIPNVQIICIISNIINASLIYRMSVLSNKRLNNQTTQLCIFTILWYTVKCDMNYENVEVIKED